MDTATGVQIRKVLIQNATNIDWEDLAMDNDFIYIGDFGNNQGSRTNLRIYKVAIQDYLNADTIQADTIQFNYADQTNFAPSSFATNFDAEALISYNNSLYIFTKNWGDARTNIYAVPKTPGQYAVNRTDSFNAQGFITGAVCDSARKQILLIGYTFSNSFFTKITAWTGSIFSSGQITQHFIQPNSSIQIEGVTQIDSTQFYISSEKFQTGIAQLHELDCQVPTYIEERTEEIPSLYPNPCFSTLHIECLDKATVCIYSLDGKLLLETNEKTLNTEKLAKGIYQVQLQIKDRTYFQKLQIQ